MTYATAADLLTRFSEEEIAQRSDRNMPRLVDAALLVAVVAGGSLTAWTAAEQAAATAALGVITGALADADSTIDGYLASRYTVPLVTPAPAVVRTACDLARYYLYDDQVTETVQKRYDAAVAWLRDVSTGKVSLGADSNQQAPASGGTVEMTTAPSVWRRDSSRGFV